jgi:hypothetical protein
MPSNFPPHVAAALTACLQRLRAKAHQEHHEDALGDFRQGFRRSAKGNLWRHYPVEGTDVTLTVFVRRDRDTYAWCVASSDGPRFSNQDFNSEDEALEDLAAEMGAEG